MPQDIFIKIGDIQGESQDKSHKGKIDVLSFTWGVSNSTPPGMARSRKATKGSVTDFHFKKEADKASPDLIYACYTAKPIDSVTLIVRKAGEKPLEYMTYTLGDVMITSVNQDGTPGNPKVIENVSLNFARIKIDYKEQTEKGGAGATPSTAFDIASPN